MQNTNIKNWQKLFNDDFDSMGCHRHRLREKVKVLPSAVGKGCQAHGRKVKIKINESETMAKNKTDPRKEKQTQAEGYEYKVKERSERSDTWCRQWQWAVRGRAAKPKEWQDKQADGQPPLNLGRSPSGQSDYQDHAMMMI